MIDIRELIADRLRRDPAFRVARDSQTGKYYLQNQVVFIYANSKSPDEATRLAGQYVEETNILRKEEGKLPLRLMILALSKSVVVVNGRSAVELTKVPTPQPPPPPPPWKKCDIRKDWVYVVQVLIGTNRVHFEVIASSYALAAGIAIGREAEGTDQ